MFIKILDAITILIINLYLLRFCSWTLYNTTAFIPTTPSGQEPSKQLKVESVHSSPLGDRLVEVSQIKRLNMMQYTG